MYEKIEKKLSENSEEKEVSYIANFGSERCAHVFKRVSPTKVECRICHVGYQDSPDDPFPIEALTEFHNNPKNREYNRWL